MLKKEIIIVVPGANSLLKWPYWIQGIVLFFLKLMKIEPVYLDHKKIWHTKIGFSKSEVLWLHWGRGIISISKWFAVRKLRRLINHFMHHPVKIIGISLGGEVIIEAIRNREYSNIKKVILVCSVNEIKKIPQEEVDTVNIYSVSDRFSKLAIELLSFDRGRRRLLGKHIKNVDLPGMTHRNFCYNDLISNGKYKGKRPTDVVNLFLKD